MQTLLSTISANLHSEKLRTYEGRLAEALSRKLMLHLESWDWLVSQEPLKTKAPLSQIHQGSLAKFLLISFVFVTYIYLSLTHSSQMHVIIRAYSTPPQSTRTF